MSNVQNSATITLGLAQTPVPAGKTFAKITVTLTDSVGAQLEQDSSGASGTVGPFDISHFAPGLLTCVATALATDGTVLATASGTATITAQVNFPAPTTVTISLS